MNKTTTIICISDLQELKDKLLTIETNKKAENKQKKVTNSEKTQKKDNNGIRIIIKNSGIVDPINNIRNHLNNNINIISLKESNMNKEVLIIETEIANINKITNTDNWKDINQKTQFTVDKYNKNINTMCINKITVNENEILELRVAKEELQDKITKDIYNIRYNRTENPNLILFEINKKHSQLFIDCKLNIPNLNKKFDVREFESIDNYIIKCHKCNKFGHYKSECQEKDKKCGRCGKLKTTCNYACDKASYRCSNCGKNHSSNYKGCDTYKKEVEKAIETKKRNEQKQQIKKIESKMENINKYGLELKKHMLLAYKRNLPW